jgi:hypothetical protein
MEVHQFLEQQSNYKLGRVVSCRLPTAVAQVRIQVRSYGICGGQSGTGGQVFSEYFSFPCHSFHQLLHTHHHPPSGAGTVGQIEADIPSGLGYTLHQDNEKKNL